MKYDRFTCPVCGQATTRTNWSKPYDEPDNVITANGIFWEYTCCVTGPDYHIYEYDYHGKITISYTKYRIVHLTYSKTNVLYIIGGQVLIKSEEMIPCFPNETLLEEFIQNSQLMS